MPRIINAYANGNDSIADSLKSLGDSMFANQAQKELIRQEALKASRQNSAATAASEAYRNNNAVELGANDILNNPDSTAMGAQALARGSLVPDATPASLGTLQIGAGHPVEATVQGQNAQLGNARTIASMDIAGAQHRQDTAPYVTGGADGVSPVIATNATAIGQPAPATEASVLGAELRRELQPAAAVPPAAPTVMPVMPSSTSNAPGAVVPPAPAATPSPAPAAQPQAPAPAPNAVYPGELPGHPDVPPPIVLQKFGMTPMQAVNPVTGQTGVTIDHGRTVQDVSNGRWYQGIGNNWQLANPEAALAQGRANSLRADATVPLPAPPTIFPQSAVDAGHTAGFDSLAQHLAPDIVEGVTGGEYGASYNRSRERLDNLVTNTRALVASAPDTPGTRQGIQALTATMKNMPVPGSVTGMTGVSATEERNSTISFIKGLRTLYASEQAEAANPHIAPADMEKLATHMRALRETIAQWEAPPPSAAVQPPTVAPTAPTQAAAPAATQGIPPRATNVKTVNGVTMYMLDGQLVQQ